MIITLSFESDLVRLIFIDYIEIRIFILILSTFSKYQAFVFTY